jgi:hemoglobin/transferrin/lactoferrin receptor protein
MKPFQLTTLCAAMALGFSAAALAADSADKQAAVHLEQVTVIADGEEQIEATGGMVVTREDLERIQPKDTAGIFQRESSVSVSGGTQAAQRVYVLGFEQSMLAVTVDGARQPGTAWHHAGNILVDPSFLKRVEVEAGAASADAGFAAAVGAVRYETVNAYDLLAPDQTVGGRVRLGYGSNGVGVSSNVSAYGKSGLVDWMVMGARQNGTNYEDGKGVELDGSAPKLTSGMAKLGLQQPEGHRYELSVEQDRDDAMRTTKMNMGSTGLFPLKMVRSTATLRYTTTQASKHYDPEIVLWYNKSDMERPNALAGRNGGDFNAWNKAWGFKAQNVFGVDAGKVTLGVDSSWTDADVERYDTVGMNKQGHIQEDAKQHGIYAQARLRYGSLGLSSGLRYDQHAMNLQDGKHVSDGGWSGNATVSYLLGEYAEAYVAASRTFLGYQAGQMGYYHARNYVTAADYSASTSHNRKLGVNFFGEQWKAGVAYFNTRLLNPTELIHTTVGVRSNGEGVTSQGWLLNAQYSWKHTTLGMNATLVNVKQGDPNIFKPGMGDAMPVGNTAAVFIDHAVPAWNTRFGASMRYAAKTDFTQAALDAAFVNQPSYAVVDVSAEWNPQGRKDLTLRVGIDNLFDRNYYYRGSYPMQEGSRPIEAIPASGRSVQVGATWTF